MEYSKIVINDIDEKPCTELNKKYLLINYVNPKILLQLDTNSHDYLKVKGLEYYSNFITQEEHKNLLKNIQQLVEGVPGGSMYLLLYNISANTFCIVLLQW